MRTRRRKKLAIHLWVILPRPIRLNEQWCMDFMADRLEDRRRIRIWPVEDVFTLVGPLEAKPSTSKQSSFCGQVQPVPRLFIPN